MAQVANLPLAGASVNPAAKDLARDMYLSGKTQTTIAGQLGVHPKTISYWIKQNNWQEIKNTLSLSPLLIRFNLFAQLQAFTEHILTREEGNNFPDSKEVNIECRLVQAIFRFPDYSYEDVVDVYKDINKAAKTLAAAPANTPLKNEISADKPTTKQIENQTLNNKQQDKEGIKTDKDSCTENAAEEQEYPGYIPKKNVVLRSGVRWIEKGLVFDPKTRQNRRLHPDEWEELLRKGLTKADFQGWHPANKA